MDFYNKNARSLSELSSRYHGLDRAVEIIESLLN